MKSLCPVCRNQNGIKSALTGAGAISFKGRVDQVVKAVCASLCHALMYVVTGNACIGQLCQFLSLRRHEPQFCADLVMSLILILTSI